MKKKLVTYIFPGLKIAEYSHNIIYCVAWCNQLPPVTRRAIIYCIALFYMFVGIAIASDIFMCSIEVITAKKKMISHWDTERNEMVEREVGDGVLVVTSYGVKIITGNMTGD